MYLTQPHFSHMYIAVLRCSGVKKIIVMCLLIVFLSSIEIMIVYIYLLCKCFRNLMGQKLIHVTGERSIRTSKFKNCPLLINYQMQSIDSYLHFIHSLDEPKVSF